MLPTPLLEIVRHNTDGADTVNNLYVYCTLTGG
jgi:hypothetical protein